MRMEQGLLLLATMLLAGCESIKTRTDYDPDAKFDAYHSFAWIDDDPRAALTPELSPLAGERIRRALLTHLTGKGYVFTENRESADFLVGFTVGVRDRVRVDTTTYPVGFRGPYGWGQVYYKDVDLRDYTEGRLAVDVFDARLKRPVWHGYATRSLTDRDRGGPEPVVNAAVEAILEDFPPPLHR